MRLGVFGGTFDPVHLGHLILAEQCREQGKLDRVLFIPAARPPHKEEEALTPFERRVEMLTLAISGQPAFAIDELEKDRPGPSYTAETLSLLKHKYADAELWLIIGADTLHDLHLWYQPARVLDLAGLLVVPRTGYLMVSSAELAAALKLTVLPRMEVVEMPLIGISSKDLRSRINAGRSVRYMLPRAVEAFIDDKGLYRQAG